MFRQARSPAKSRSRLARLFRCSVREALNRGRLKPVFEGLESRALLATVSWDGGAGNLNWFNAQNWDSDSLPRASDDVVISNIASDAVVVADAPIIVNTLTQTAGRIDLSETLVGSISQSGSLNLTGPAINGVNGFYKAEVLASDSGGTNSGTFVNGATTTPFGKIGSAFTFDGVNDHVNLGSGTSLNTPGSMTIAAWVKFDQLTGGQYLIADIDATGNLSQGSLSQSVDGFGNPRFFWHQTTDVLNPYGPNNGRILNPSTNLTTGQWYHIAIVRNDSAKTVQMYLNGVLEGASTYTGSVVNLQRNKILGTAESFFHTAMHGQMDEVGFFGRALSAAEVASLASASSTLISGSTLRIPKGATSGPVSLDAGGTLKGSGTVGGDLNNEGILSPGNSPGIIVVNGNYAQAVTGSLEIEVQGTNPSTPDFDQLFVNGTVTLAGALDVSLLNGFAPSAGDSFQILSNDGGDAIVGTFIGLPEGAVFVHSGTYLQISYVGGTGNDVVLTAISPAPIIVSNSNDQGAGSLRQAILDANANPGFDIIKFDPLASAIKLTSGELQITDNLVIDASASTSGVIVSGEDLSRLFTVSVGVNFTIDSLTLSNGRPVGSGGAIVNNGSTFILRTTLRDNRSLDDAGAISNLGTLTIDRSTFTGNSTANDGGAVRSSGMLRILNSTFANNEAGIAGGGVRNDGTMLLSNTIVSANVAAQGEDVFGTVASKGYNLIERITNGQVTGVTTGNIHGLNALLGPLGNYGGLTDTLPISVNSPAYNAGTPSSIRPDQRGQAAVGANDIGAFESEVNRFFVTTTDESGVGSIRQAVADSNNFVGTDNILFSGVSGVIFLTSGAGELALTDSVNVIGPGATQLAISGYLARVFSIEAGVTASISGLTIVNGSVGGFDEFSSYGGGIRNSGSLTLSNAIVRNNRAVRGGGIYNQGTLVIENSTISDNVADITGGGVENYGFSPNTTTLIDRSTISGNSASYGGGVGNDNTATGSVVTIINSTIHANTAAGNGGGLVGTRFDLTNVTIANNSAPDGGGIQVGFNLSMNNTIVARNSAASGAVDVNVVGGTASGTFNLIGISTGSPSVYANGLNGNRRGTPISPLNPLLGALATNFGTTKTLALLAGSPAINNGSSALAPATDQRGVSRIGTADIGAFEANRNFFLVSSNGDSGAGTLRQAITDANSTANLAGGEDIIQFAIGSGPASIQPTSALPSISSAMFVDATTQPGFIGTPIVELRGNNAGVGSSGFTITGAGSTIQGLVINRFNQDGITITGEFATGNTIRLNVIGLNANGDTAAPNGQNGIRIRSDASGNLIGGSSNSDANVIAGNSGFGVLGDSDSPTINTVQNNDFAKHDGVSAYIYNTLGDLLSSGSGETKLGGSFPKLVRFDNGTLSTTDFASIKELQQDGGAIHVTAGTELELGNSITPANPSRIRVGSIVSDGRFVNRGSVTFTNPVTISLGATGVFRTDAVGPTAQSRFDEDVTITGSATFDQVIISSLGISSMYLPNAGTSQISASFSNLGRLYVEAGQLSITGNVRQAIGQTLTDGTWETRNTAGPGGTILLASASDFTTIGTNATVGLQEQSSFPRVNTVQTVNGRLLLGGDFVTSGPLENNGTIALVSISNIQNLLVNGSYTQTGNTFLGDVVGSSHTLQADTIQLSAGLLNGNGLVAGDVINSGGNVNAGSGFGQNGVITILGNYTQDVGGTFTVDASGTNSVTPEFDQVAVTGTANLNGTLSVRQFGGFILERPESLQVLSFASVNGDFSILELPSQDGWAMIEPRLAPTFLELVGTSILVRDTVDSGPGSLRDAINIANASPGPDAIFFNIPGVGNQFLLPSSPLPVITDQLLLDATTQFGFVDAPLVELSGDAAGPNANGFEFGPGSDNSRLRGFIINRFSDNGVSVAASSVTIAGNYIGTDQSGTSPASNVFNGIILQPSLANNTTIGGLNPGDRNVISGNNSNGIFAWSVTGTTIQGNYIGLDATGTTSISNFFNSVLLLGGDGAVIEAGNVISGGTNTPGIKVEGAANSLIRGNLIGTSADGLTAVGNDIGIWVTDNLPSAGSNGTVIGGTTEDERNLISGNHTGIYISGSLGANTQILGNWIGLDATGQNPLANNTGIQVDGGTTILIGGPTSLAGTEAGNIIAANSQEGILLNGGTGIVVSGNMIGLASDGNTPLGNGTGLFANLDADGVMVGGNTPNTRNIISGNFSGLTFHRVADGIVRNNYIGLNRDGNHGVGNQNGIELAIGASNFTIGGDASNFTNIVSGNLGFGIVITGDATTGNVVGANWIGLAADGITAIGNQNEGVEIDAGAHHNTIGGFTTGAGNTIVGNSNDGVGLFTGAHNNTIVNNFIGNNGVVAIPNLGSGIVVNSAHSNFVIQNTIGGNKFDGVVLFGADARENTLNGNRIGTNFSGRGSIPNDGNGVLIIAGANSNTVGGNTATERNVIGGNQQTGVNISGVGTENNTVIGNFIGTNQAGTDQLYPYATAGWWKAENNSVNTVDGVSASIHGDTTYVDSVVHGNAFRFGGNSSYLSVPDSTELTITTAITLEAWVNPTAYDLSGPNGLGAWIIGKPGGYQLTLTQLGAVRFQLPGIQFGADAQLETSSFLPLNQWSHIAGTYDGITGDWRIYINGTQAANTTQVGTISTTSVSLQIGGTLSPDLFFTGSIDEPAVYGRALTATDIQRIVAANATGKGAGSSLAGVSVIDSASNNTIRGNVISGNGSLTSLGGGVVIQAANNNLVLGNKIGTDVTGTKAIGNYVQGIWIDNASGNQIGSGVSGDGNLISGNGLETRYGYHGLFLGDSAHDNRVQGNFIGTDVSGNVPLLNSVLTPGSGVGIDVFGDQNFIGTDNDGNDDATEGNVVGDFKSLGVSIFGNGNTIAGNAIGVGFDGVASIPNNFSSNSGGGISIAGVKNVIGGSSLVTANVISGNNRKGILIFGSDATENRIEGNFIGLLKDGSTVRGNNGDSRIDAAVLIYDGAKNTQVLRNVISGNNTIGIHVRDAHSSGTIIQANIIGANESLTAARPNGSGILISGGPAGTVVGGVNASEGNIVSGNSSDGIAVTYFQEDLLPTWLRADGNTADSSIYRAGLNLAPTVSTFGVVGYQPGKYGEAFQFVAGDGYLQSFGGFLNVATAGASFWFRSTGTPRTASS